MLLLIPLLPFLGFVVNACLGRRLSRAISGGVACAAIIASFGISVASVAAMRGAPSHRLEQTVYTWLPSADLQVPFELYLDPLAAVMILVVTGIGSLIHVYSIGYMHEESGGEYARYFSYLNLFAAFMLVLVLGASFPVMFVGWEGVGLCSYLLIGFWFTKQSAADAGKKAFVVNRIGDFGFIVGMLLVFFTFGTLDFQEVAGHAAGRAGETAAMGAMTMATLLLVVGAAGKSAQLPLYVWLPDAMEGPTPVSALIHAATMVTAGVYMIGRNAVLFSHAPITLEIVAIVGLATALMAGTIGLVQNDIKRVLAYSTVSQLGYMFLAMGVGAFGAGIFHLYTHAFFKALLFLGSGAVIHALHGEQDLRNMGGLKTYLPVTYWTFVIGALAIAGVPALSGFFSKDEILFRTFTGTAVNGHQGYPVLWALGVLTSLLTAIYMFRLVFMAFHGERRSAHAREHREEEEPAARHHAGQVPHEAPPSMAVPLVVLAIGSVLAGYIGVPHALGGSNRLEEFLHPSFEPPAHAGRMIATAAETSAVTLQQAGAQSVEAQTEPHVDETTLELTLMGVSSVAAIAGILFAAYFWLWQPGAAAAVSRRFAGLYRLLYNKYFVDELYDAAVVQPIKQISTAVLWKGVDAGGIDGAVNGVGLLVRTGSSALRRLQTGSMRVYAAWLFLGSVMILGWYLWS